jgi:cystathionine beta-lyase/cystathionine gamma-synthase
MARADTRLIHGKHRTEKWDYDHHVIPPITASTAFRLDSADRGQQGFVDFANPKAAARAMNPIYIYDRLDEPTVGMLEDLVREAEGGECAIAFACGMAAISASLMVTGRAGSNVVAHRTMYGCTFSLMSNWMPRFGLAARFVDGSDRGALLAAVDDKTRAVYLETPANPTMECLDLAAIRSTLAPVNAGRGPKDQVVVIVDNTFATPWGQRPLSLGADIVVASLTKNVGGFGIDLGGMVVAPERFLKSFRGYRKDFGGVLPPHSAWNYMVYGLPTLPIRLARQMESAAAVSAFLEAHPRVARVSWPGLESFPWKEVARRQLVDPEGRFCPGSMIYFEVAGDLDESRARCARVVDHIAKNAYSVTLAVSLGMTKTLIEAPGLMTHSALDACAQSVAGIHPGGIRLSLGLECADDVIGDLAAALDRC